MIEFMFRIKRRLIPESAAHLVFALLLTLNRLTALKVLSVKLQMENL